MSKNNNYKPGPNDFLDYSEGKLKGRKRNAFERYLAQNLFDAEAAEGLELVSREEAEQDLASAGKQIRNRINRKRRIGWYSAAAAVVTILAVSTIFFNVDRSSMDQKEMIQELPKGMEPAVTEKKAEKSDQVLKESEEAKDIEEIPEEIAPAEVITEEVVTGEAKSVESVETNQITREEERTPDNQDDASAQLGAGAVADELVEENVTEELLPSPDTEEVTQDFAMDMEDEVHMESKTESLAAPAQPMASAREKSAMKRVAVESDNSLPSAVRGVVISAEDATPIPGATIMLKGTAVGTVADSEGNFELDLDNASENRIVASFIGMESKEMEVQAGKDIEIAMNESLVSLDEVVVVGYGTSRKSDLTGSQSIVSNITGAVPEIGLSAYNAYIDNELVFPRSDYDNSRAVVVVKFVVLQNKRPYNIQVVKSPSQAFFNEAQRVVFSGPDWIPASKNGVFVEDEVSLRIVFKEEHKR